MTHCHVALLLAAGRSLIAFPLLCLLGIAAVVFFPNLWVRAFTPMSYLAYVSYRETDSLFTAWSSSAGRSSPTYELSLPQSTGVRVLTPIENSGYASAGSAWCAPLTHGCRPFTTPCSHHQINLWVRVFTPIESRALGDYLLDRETVAARSQPSVPQYRPICHTHPTTLPLPLPSPDPACVYVSSSPSSTPPDDPLASTCLLPPPWAHQVVFGSMMFLKALSYSLNNPCKEMLYNPTSTAVKFKSKSWIDIFGQRGR